MAALACYKAGEPSRLIYRPCPDARPDGRKSFSRKNYRYLIQTAHQQLVGPIVLVWETLNTQLTAGMRPYVAERDWLTTGQRGASPPFQVVLGRIRVPRLGPGHPRTRPDKVRADKAYGSRSNRAYLCKHGIRCTIPQKRDQIANRKKRGSQDGRPPKFDAADDKVRHAAECGINRFK